VDAKRATRGCFDGPALGKAALSELIENAVAMVVGTGIGMLCVLL